MLYQQTTIQFAKVLRNLLKIIEKGNHYAEAKKFDTSVYLHSRLAPDQLAFTKQIQIACDTAKLFASRVSGKEAPMNDDSEKTMDELKARIQSTATYLDSFKGTDFSSADTKKITRPRWEGKYLTSEEYTYQHAIPNFYFHVTTAYAILRHNGVDIGKKDYLGELPFKH